MWKFTVQLFDILFAYRWKNLKIFYKGSHKGYMVASNCRVNINLLTLMSQTANNAKLLINFYNKLSLNKLFDGYLWKIILSDFQSFFFFFGYWQFSQSFPSLIANIRKLFEIAFELKSCFVFLRINFSSK